MMYDVTVFEDRRSSNDQLGFQKSHSEDRFRKCHLRVWTKRENQKRLW